MVEQAAVNRQVTGSNPVIAVLVFSIISPIYYMGLGFTNTKEEEVEEQRLLCRTIIECPFCGDDTLMNVYKGYCQCGNLYISVREPLSKVRYRLDSTWTHLKTVHYKNEAPLIYEVLRSDDNEK